MVQTEEGTINYRIENARELIKDENMRGKTLASCFTDIAYQDCGVFSYPLHLDEFSGFVQSWIGQNRGLWKFNNPIEDEGYLKVNLTEKQYLAKTLREFLEVTCNNIQSTSKIIKFNLSEEELAKQIRYKMALFQGLDLQA